MPKIKGQVKEKITFGCDPLPFNKIQKAIENKEFSTVTDLINTALIFYFENRNKTESQAIKEFMESSDGEELFKRLFKKYEESVSKNKESSE